MEIVLDAQKCPTQVLASEYTSATMDSLIGVTGKGYVILAADMSAARSILAYQYADDKVRCGAGVVAFH